MVICFIVFAFSIKLGQPLLKETNIRYTFECHMAIITSFYSE